MSVLSGYNKYKRYIKTSDGYKLCSEWTSSNTVQMDDGNTLQTNLGAINGITDSLTATSSNIAASAAAVKTLNDSLNTENEGYIIIGNQIIQYGRIECTRYNNKILNATITLPVEFLTTNYYVYLQPGFSQQAHDYFDIITSVGSRSKNQLIARAFSKSGLFTESYYDSYKVSVDWIAIGMYK